MEPLGMETHPESIDPVWFQELIRRAFQREMRRIQKLDVNITADEALERAMWYVFELRNSLTDLYHAGKEQED